ncbi:hypothetical protein PgNI_10937 [Pyricularia grisea]|uniref:C2H2-type domain-containing protein n=1 Tax=Pyricularia grisea TaxID=148305 RepID=A0A6P8AZ01_PYRGI|nr:hypothetical protein PgNI_10937 [Pyricularia grisea]TLD07565.1 hypothetical protein PgNI_10937 [Pyricularia grisea]
MQIFNIVQVLGLLAVGASALPTSGACPPQCLNAAGAKPGNIQARSAPTTQYPRANQGYPTYGHAKAWRCDKCNFTRQSKDSVNAHLEHYHGIPEENVGAYVSETTVRDNRGY